MKIKNFIKQNKKQAQHIVELALVMPLFIIIFSLIFQLLIGTYVKYKFSYILTNSIKAAIQNQPIFNTLNNALAYNIINVVQENMERTLGIANNGQDNPMAITIRTIETMNITFLLGAFQYSANALFFGQIGKEYFQFFVPVNTAYIKPLVLNETTGNIEDYFTNYYTAYYSQYFEGAEGP